MENALTAVINTLRPGTLRAQDLEDGGVSLQAAAVLRISPDLVALLTPPHQSAFQQLISLATANRLRVLTVRDITEIRVVSARLRAGVA